MATIKFTHQNKSREIYQNDACCYEYSDAPEALGKFIRELEILTCDLSLADDSWHGKRQLMSYVRIGHRGRVLGFDYYHSLYDTTEWGIDGLDSGFLKNVLESLLYTIRSSAGVHEFNFAEFCNECGYDEDSHKAYATYEQGVDFSRKIARVFSDEEIASFPYCRGYGIRIRIYSAQLIKELLK